MYTTLIVVACVGLLVLAYFLDRKNKQETEKAFNEKGKTVNAWIVQANDALYQKRDDDRPALVLFSLPGQNPASDPVVQALAQKIFDLRSTARTPLERSVAEIALDERFIDAKSGQLPFEFTAGKTVYWIHIRVCRRQLPGGYLRVPYVQLSVAPTEKKIYYRHVPYLKFEVESKLPSASNQRPSAVPGDIKLKL